MYVFSSIGYVFPPVLFGGNQRWGDGDCWGEQSVVEAVGSLQYIVAARPGGGRRRSSLAVSVEEGARWRDPRDMVRQLQVVHARP